VPDAPLPDPATLTTPDQLRIVVPRFGESVVGGAESAMRRLGHALCARGWDVDVWTTTAFDEATWESRFTAGYERDGDIEVRRFPVVVRRRPWLFAQLSRGAYHLPAHLRPEHLWSIAQGPYSPALIGALARAQRRPTLFSPYLFHPTLFGVAAAPHPRLITPAAHDEPALRLRIVRRALLSADGLWFHSPEERELVATVHPQTRARPSECGVVGVDVPADVDDRAFATRRGIPGPYLYYGGRIAGAKGSAMLVETARLLSALHPSASVVLSGEAGDGPDAPGLRRVGRLDEHERWEAIAGAAAVVVPSSLESLSLLALEAWALGRPCLLNVATPVLAGHLERSAGGLGFASAGELVARAAELVDNPERARAMGERGRAYVVATYRWDLAEARLRALLAAAS
jgi:glycosyltransferase involved in cell wall biosynthesis